jgi:hypothetical protein
MGAPKNYVPPTLAGAGAFVGRDEAYVAGSQSGFVSYPVQPLAIGSVRRVTVITTDATIPQVSISDDDGSTFTPISGQPANQAQWTCSAIAAHAVGSTNRLHVVFPNAIHKGTSPTVVCETFQPPS